MKVIAKYRTVHVTYPDGEVKNIHCKSIRDALEFTKRFISAIPYRERAVTDTSYLTDFYTYLKSKGYIETELYKSHMRLLNKAKLVQELAHRWM